MDGPSAGVTMASALTSLAFNQPLKQDLAMTGEVTLTGKVLRVGGIKEKVIAAKREQVTTLVLPMQNRADFMELKDYVRSGITAHFVDHYDDVYRLALDGAVAPALLRSPLGQQPITIAAPTEDLAEQVEEQMFIPIAPEPLPTSTSIA